jgi:hypothetical protein
MPENGSILNGKMPWWVQAIGIVGTTAAIALYLVYWQTQSLGGVLTNMTAFMAHHEAQEAQVIKDEEDDSKQRTSQWDMISKIQEAQRANYEAQLELEQQTCINAAKSNFQTDKCLAVRNNGEKIGNEGR